MLLNLMESNTFLISRSVLMLSIFSINNSFFSKYLLFLAVSHQFFQVLNLMQALSALYY
jgi:hypothetical protein